MRCEIFQYAQQLFRRLCLTYDANVVCDRQYLRHSNPKKLLMISDDDVDHDCTFQSYRTAESVLSFLR